jgi:hypothetical protein
MYNLGKIEQRLKENLINIKGWRTSRRLVVIESDDWGSIRMPSKKVFNDLLKANIRVDKCPFCSYDSLASEDDLTSLFEVLESVSDIHGHHPVFTANTVVANPDFGKILASGFKEYYYELFSNTLQKYPDHRNSLTLWNQGIKAGLFYPQLHGREHLHVNRWMRALRKGLPVTQKAFEYGFFGISTDISSEIERSYLAAFDAESNEEIIQHKTIIEEAVCLFNNIFNFYPKTFAAPNYIWSKDLETYLLQKGIKIIQGSKLQLEPNLKSGYNRKHHFLGQKNKIGQFYTIRNCLFEPSLSRSSDWVSACLRQIQTSFFWGKPAIIGTHRVNYIGYICEKNRQSNLILLSKLLNQILKCWPDVEFLTSEEFSDCLLANEKTN